MKKWSPCKKEFSGRLKHDTLAILSQVDLSFLVKQSSFNSCLRVMLQTMTPTLLKLKFS